MEFVFDDCLMESISVSSLEDKDIAEIVRENAHVMLDCEMDLEDILAESTVDIVMEGAAFDKVKAWIKGAWDKIVKMWQSFIAWIKSLGKKDAEAIKKAETEGTPTKKPETKTASGDKGSKEEDKTGKLTGTSYGTKRLGDGSEPEKAKSEDSPKYTPEARPETKARGGEGKFKFVSPFYDIQDTFECVTLANSFAAKPQRFVKSSIEDIKKEITECMDYFKRFYDGCDEDAKKEKDISSLIILGDGKFVTIDMMVNMSRCEQITSMLNATKASMEKSTENVFESAEQCQLFITRATSMVTQSLQLVNRAVKTNKDARIKCIASYKKYQSQNK